MLQLAIIDKELFETAQKRKSERSFEAPEKQRRAKFLLSGLLKCGCCGGGLAMKDRDHGRVRIHCSTMKEAGTCSNRKIFYMDEIERSVLAGLQRNLKSPHLLKEFVTAYLLERQRLASEKTQRRSQTENQLAQLERSIDWLWADYENKRVPVEIAGPAGPENSTTGRVSGSAGSGEANRTSSGGPLRNLPVSVIHGGHFPSFGATRYHQLIDEYLAGRRIAGCHLGK